MADRKGVAIRIGTEGKAQVKSDFAEIRQAGEAAFEGIGGSARAMTAANENQFNRLAAGYEKAVAEMEAADRRRAATADKLNAIAPRTALQATIDNSVGHGGVRMSQTGGYDPQAKSARDSAAALRELLALEDAQLAKAAALRAIIDPLGAAQDRYSQAMATTIALRRNDKLTAQEARQYQVLLKEQLDQATVAHGAAAQGAGAHRAGLQQLGFQASDFFVQISSGTDAVRAFSLQAPQAIQAIALMGHGADASKGKFAAFAAFMGGHWGAAITVAVSIIGALASGLLKSGEATDESAEKLRKQAQQAKVSEQAQKAFGNTIEGVTTALAENREALDQMGNAGKTAARIALEAALAERAKAAAIRASTKASLDDAEALYEIQKQRASGPGEANERAALGLANRIDAIKRLREALADTDGAIAEADRQIEEAYSRRLVEIGQEGKAGEIDRRYDRLIEQARRRAVAEDAVGAALTRQVEQYDRMRDRDQAKEREANREPRREPSVGSQVEATRSADLYAIANRYRGLSETADNGQLRELLTQVSGNIDPKITAWCAAFVNAVLATDGLAGTGSLAARSFLDYGTATSNPVQGDIVVTRRGNDPNAGHVGFYQGRDAQGNILVLGGNTGNKVGTMAVAPNDVLGFRHVTAGSADRQAEQRQREAEQSREEAIRRQRDYDLASATLDERELQARRAAMIDLDEIAKFDRLRVEAEKQRFQLATEAKVQLGDLTRTQADELKRKNAIVAALNVEAIERQRKAGNLRDAAQLDGELDGHQIAVLRSQGELADTAAERRVIALQILDLEKEEARRRYQLVIDLGKIGQATAEQVRAAQAGLATLDTIYGNRGKGALEDTAGPLESYSRDMDLTKEQIYERVQDFAVDELEYFRKGLNDAITEKLGIKDPFLSQLINLFIEQWLIKPITEALATSMSGGASGGGVGGFIKGAIGQLLGGGGPENLLAGTPYGNAIGTENFSGGYTWLAENGPELVRLPGGSKVTPAAQTRRLLAGSNDNRPVVYQNFDFAGAVTTEELMQQAEARSRAAAEQATANGISGLIDANRRSYGRLLAAN